MSLNEMVAVAQAVQKFNASSAVQNAGSTMEQPPPNGVRPKAAARRLGMSDATFWRKVGEGKIKVTKISARITLVAESEIAAVMSGQRV